MSRNKPIVTLILDTRRALRSGLYPIKLRATFHVGTKWQRYYYSTGSHASENDFKAIMGNPRTPEQRTTRAKILALESKVLAQLDKYDYVNKDLFDRLLDAGSYNVLEQFDKRIEELKKSGRIGSMGVYQTARNSFEKFAKGSFIFQEVTQRWLENYVKSMQERSPGTVALYLACLRAIFNDAVHLRLISPEHYPFGPRRFPIKAHHVKRYPLSVDQKNQLLALQTEDSKIRRAVDFFLLSYFCNGANMNDILRWKRKNIKQDHIVWYRVKTRGYNAKPIVAIIRPEVARIIARHGDRNLDPDAFVFPVISLLMTPVEQRKAISNFVVQINKGLSKVVLDPPMKLTTYTARHTFANISLNAGASKEYIQEALGHKSMMTTEEYIEGFELATKKKMAGKL